MIAEPVVFFYILFVKMLCHNVIIVDEKFAGCADHVLALVPNLVRRR